MPALTIMLGGKLARGGLSMMTGKKFAAGGVVPGSGNRDTVPAMLTPGEFVIRKKAVGAIGTDNLHQMNKYAYGGPVSFKGITGAKQGGKSLSPRLAKSKGEAYKQGALINAGDKFSQDINEKEFTSLSIGATLKGKRGAAATIRKLSDRNQNVRGAEFENFLAKYIAGAGNKTTGNAPLDFTGPPGEAKFQTRGVPYRDLLSKTLRQRIDSGKYASLRDSKGGVPSESLQSFENIYASGINLFKLKGKFNAKTARDAAGLNKKKRKATGGGISGSDTVPALLTPGEFVINKKAASRIGASKLHNMNQADRVTGYNKGGFVQKFAAGGPVAGLENMGDVSAKEAAKFNAMMKTNSKELTGLYSKIKTWPAEDIKSAMTSLYRSISKGETDMDASYQKAITQTTRGSGGAQRQAKKGMVQQTQGFQETRTKESIVADRVAAGGLGTSGNDVARADRETDKARGRLEAAYGTKKGMFSKGGKPTEASEKALKVFRKTLLETNDTTKAMAAAEQAAVQSITNSSKGVNSAFKRTTAASKGLFPTFSKAGTAVKAFGAKLAKTRVGQMGKGFAQKMTGNSAGAVMGRQMAGAAVVAGAGMGVTALSNAYKGPGGKETDNSRLIAGGGQGALTGGAMGAQIGMMFGPIGGAVGGVVGALGGLTLGLINAAKENAKAAAQERKNNKQKYDEQTSKSANIAIDQSKSGSERAAARETYMKRLQANRGAGLSVAKGLMATGSTAEEASAAGATNAATAVKMFTSEATRTGKTLAEMQATMPGNEFNLMKETILAADKGYLEAVEAHGKNSDAARKAAEAAMENVKEMTDTNAELAKHRSAIAAVAAVSDSYVVAARNLNGAIQAAEASFKHAEQEMATIKDPTAAVSYRNRNLEVASNPASTGAAQSAAYSGMAAGLGGPGQAMANMAAMPKSLEEGISQSIQRTINAKDPADVEKDVKQTVKARLVAAGVKDKDADIAAGKYAGRIGGMSTEERANLNVEKDMASDPALAGLMDGANASGEALKNYYNWSFTRKPCWY